MGVYDYYDGDCPHCGKKFVHIQTKDFVYMREGDHMTNRNEENCFRTFTVGTQNGCFPMNACVPLDETCSKCHTDMVAIFDKGTLVRFDVIS